MLKITRVPKSLFGAIFAGPYNLKRLRVQAKVRIGLRLGLG